MLQWCGIAATVWITVGHRMFQMYIVIAAAWVTVPTLALLCAGERVNVPHADAGAVVCTCWCCCCVHAGA